MRSPDFIEASSHHTDLLALQGDEAYSSPAMDGVTAQLGRVPVKSSDYNASVALLATIASERARIAAAAAKGAVQPPPPAAPTFPAFANSAATDPKAAAAPAPAVVDELARGADFAALQARYVGCLLSQGTISMLGPDGGTSQMEGFGLHDSASCRSRIPDLGTHVVLVQAGKIAYLLPQSALKTVTTLEDGGTLPVP